jgi:oligoribonuclease NrnB/cAMP/cGMP phosphodiesterase (DHH superfamily)
LTELVIKVVETWKSSKDKDENGKILRDLVMMTAERDSWKEDYEREMKEKDDCKKAREKAEEKAERYRDELYAANIKIATLTGSQVVQGGSASSGLLRPPPLSEGK